uniref:Cytochrome c4 n=1 Tax=Simulacricoccus ruber TaxID=2303410 RepID=A0A3S7UVG4_9BACT|nr:cytochrome c4 [Simulacricoccus ruber]
MSERESGPRRAGGDGRFEPYEEPRPVPLPVYWIAIALALWGVMLLYEAGESVRTGRGERLQRIVDDRGPVRRPGVTLFHERCATCHQVDGAGLSGAVPPLDGSPFVTGEPRTVARILLHGIRGPIHVAGRDYDGNMPDFASVLSDAEVAEVGTYIRQAWSNRAGPLTVADVAAVRREPGPAGPWSGGAELVAASARPGAYEPQPPPAPVVAPPADTGSLLAKASPGGRWPCASCHGAHGEGSLNVPRLAGLDAGYIERQLLDYRTGRRRNEPMSIVARSLDPQELGLLARHYAGLSPGSTARPGLGGQLLRGQQLALVGDESRELPACFSCHGPSGFGVGPFPTLAAQHPAYTVAQLNAFAAGHRDNDPTALMRHIAKKLDTLDRRSVSDYLSTLPPVPPRRARAPTGE